MDETTPPRQAGYDPAQREAAARLARENPGWYVMWGAWTRRYFAYPVFDVPPGTLFSATSISNLLIRMRQAELAAMPGPRAQPHQLPISQQGQQREEGSCHA